MSQINARLVYRNAKRSMVAAGVDPSKAILSQSFLRLERVANTATTNYQFGVLLNDSPQGAAVRPTEQRLQLQDAFFCSSVQVFYSLATSATATNYGPITWPNPFDLTTAGASAAMYNFYNGTMSLTVNNRTIVTSWDLFRHLEVPQTQKNNAAGAGVNHDQLTGGYSTSFVCEPNWVLIGSKNNQLSIQLPAAIGTLQAGVTTVLTVLMRGVLAQNCTVVS
jgi:hypothetical protein